MPKYTIPPNTVVLHKLPYQSGVGESRKTVLGLLESYTGITAADLRIVEGTKGKPALHPSHQSDIHFNLSHCNDIAVYAFARGFEIGVDIEKIRPSEQAWKIAERFFSADDKIALKSSLQPDMDFMRLWTRNEALAKAFGVSVWDALKQSEIGSGLSVHEFIPGDGYVGCVIAQIPESALVSF